jgi:hypothetical protein
MKADFPSVRWREPWESGAIRLFMLTWCVLASSFGQMEMPTDFRTSGFNARFVVGNSIAAHSISNMAVG